MIPKHTPGPWSASYGEDDDGGTVYGSEANEVAVTRGWGAAARADCDLIAAAPEMLDALRQWKAAEDMGDDEEVANARRSRDRAIVRALGGKP